MIEQVQIAHLKVVRTLLVVLAERLLKDDDRVADKEVRKVRREALVHPPLDEVVSDLGVDRHVIVVVFGSVRRGVGDVAVDGIVARFRDHEAVVLQRLAIPRDTQRSATLLPRSS